MSGNNGKVCAKGKRGRPTKFTDKEIERARSVIRDRTMSPRTMQNACYWMRGLDVVTHFPGLTWLADRDAMLAGRARSKKTIITELGRLETVEEMRAMAELLCKEKPTTGAAVAMIRAHRTGDDRAGDAVSLTMAIARTIDDYVTRNPLVSKQKVLAALGNVLDIVEEESDEG